MRRISSSRVSASGVDSKFLSERRNAVRQSSNKLRIAFIWVPLASDNAGGHPNRPRSAAGGPSLFQGRLEQLVHPAVLVVPSVGVAEPVAPEREIGRAPV